MNDTRLTDFLTESLALWEVTGTVEGGRYPVIAAIRADNGTLVWVERPADENDPIRWLVRMRPAGEAPGGAREQRPRSCASIVGVLKALRVALGVDRGEAVRVVSAPVDS
ncbi:MAG: hypothetical protein V4637_15505 [Pseudomonadota bacterium]